ncbi:uncharacterized protein TNCV_1928221 [Trichonephila clavipes]|nr:uncharacterized protein TNCV_1928221 [Trichonephila clavipes]
MPITYGEYQLWQIKVQKEKEISDLFINPIYKTRVKNKNGRYMYHTTPRKARTPRKASKNTQNQFIEIRVRQESRAFYISDTHRLEVSVYDVCLLVESFFKNDEGHNVTVNGDRYKAGITNFFIPELNNHDVQELWFQQDGAACHTAHATIDLLKDTLGDLLISRFGPLNWPPRPCDLTPLDYFLWVYVKSLVYAEKPQTLDHLEDNIRRLIADIRPQMLQKVIESWTSRLDYIRASRGSPMPEIIFKM